jgi:ketosteroid isomerase-like protein
MAEHPNVALVREMFAAMDRGDTQWLMEHTADDIAWHVGGNSRSAGVYRGKEEVQQMMGAATDPSAMKVDLHDFLGNDDHVAVLGTAHVTAPSGKSVDYNFINVFHVRDEKVTEAWGMSENDAETDPIWDEFAPS